MCIALGWMREAWSKKGCQDWKGLGIRFDNVHQVVRIKLKRRRSSSERLNMAAFANEDRVKPMQL